MIIFNEIKKIFNSKMIFLLIIINLILYFLFIEFNIEYFPNGRPEKDDYNIHVEMKQKYGAYMDNKEFQDFKKVYNKKLQQVNEYIKNNKEFKKCGINNYKEFVTKTNKINSKEEKFEKLHDKVVFQDEVDLFWEIPQRKLKIDMYENKNKEMLTRFENINENQKLRIKNILLKGEDTSVLPELIIDNYNYLIKEVTMTILISVIFMISPIYIKDKKRNVNYIQYTTKKGRKLFLKKGIAGIIVAIIITTVQLIIFFTMYAHNKTYMFLDCNINSVFNFWTSWNDITFKQYMGITIIDICILVIACSLISMFISSMSKNYITIIGIQILIIVGFYAVVLEKIITKVGYIIFAKYSIILCYLCIFIMPVILFLVRWKKEKILDIQN